MRKVVVLGASANPLRFSYKAISMLLRHKFEVIPVGLREGTIGALKIVKGKPFISGVDTLVLYINPDIQRAYYDYIFELNPRLIVFNPGTENFELANLAAERGIRVEFDCAIMMLQEGEF
jgi:predicted CoA-binding protein